MKRITCKALLAYAYKAEMVIQPVEKGRYQLQYIPLKSAPVFTGSSRECAIFLKGFYLGDNKRAMEP